MGELVEKVAREICALNIEYAGPKDDRLFADRVDNEWHDWRDEAIAVIAIIQTDLDQRHADEMARTQRALEPFAKAWERYEAHRRAIPQDYVQAVDFAYAWHAWREKP